MMDLMNFLSDDELFSGAHAFSGPLDAAGTGYGPVMCHSQCAVDSPFSVFDSAHVDAPPIEPDDCMNNSAQACIETGLPHCSGDKRQQRREKNRLKQAAYRQKMKAQRTELEMRVQELETKLVRGKVAKERLASVNSTLLTRLKVAMYALDSAVNPTLNSDATSQADGRQVASSRRVGQRSSLPDESSLVPCHKPPVHKLTRPSPRPLESYARSASVSYENILPHLPEFKNSDRCKEGTSVPGITDPNSSRNISFVEVSLVREALDCHQRLTLSKMRAIPGETAWYLEFPYAVSQGLRLSHSTSMASPECHLSTSIAFWVVALESAFLKLLEDRCLAEQRSLHEHRGIEELHDSFQNPPADACSSCKGPGRFSKPPKVPEQSLRVPEPEMQPLKKFGVMCGRNRRVRIHEAVQNLLPHVAEKYRKHLPPQEWGAVCMQVMHAMQAQLQCVQQCASLRAGQPQPGGDHICMGGWQVFDGEADCAADDSKSPSTPVATYAMPQPPACATTATTGDGSKQPVEAVLTNTRSGDMHDVMPCVRSHTCNPEIVARSAAAEVNEQPHDLKADGVYQILQQWKSGTNACGEPGGHLSGQEARSHACAPVDTSVEAQSMHDSAAPHTVCDKSACMQSMRDSEDDDAPAGAWGLPHTRINRNDLEHICSAGSLASQGRHKSASCPCAQAGYKETAPFWVCGFGSCAGVGGAAETLEGGSGGGCAAGTNAPRPGVVGEGLQAHGGASSPDMHDMHARDGSRQWSEGPGQGGAGAVREFPGRKSHMERGSMLGVTGRSFARIASTFNLDDSSQHAQHADGVSECPWAELEAVAVETVKFMLTTLHASYSAADKVTNSRVCVEHTSTRPRMHEACSNRQGLKQRPRTRALDGEASHPQEELDDARISGALQMTHECILARTRALNISTAVSAVLLLADAPVAYRHMTQPPVLVSSWVEGQQLRIYKYLGLNRTQKEHFAAMWHGWKRRRKALDREFAAAVSLVSSFLPSLPPSGPHKRTQTECESPNLVVATGTFHAAACAATPDHTFLVSTSAAQTTSVMSPVGAGKHQKESPARGHMGVAKAPLTSPPCPERGVDSSAESQRVAFDETRAAADAYTHLTAPHKPSVSRSYVIDPDVTSSCSHGAAETSVYVSAVLKLLEASSQGKTCAHDSATYRLVAATVGALWQQEGGEGGGLMGASGARMAAAQVALAALHAVHRADDRMLQDYSALVLMPTWGLAEVEMRRFWAALLEVQVPIIDMLQMFRAAAHDIAREDLFSSIQHMSL